MGAEPTSRFNGTLPHGWDPVSHAEAIKSTEELELVALCDVDAAKTERFSKLYNVSATYNNYRDLINEVKPDILSIATRTDVKAEIIYYALEHGIKGFYVEKPLSRSVAECEQVLNKIAAAGAKLVYGAQRRAMPLFKQVKYMCHSGLYGDLKHITFEYGRNMLLWSHPHTTDLIVFLANSLAVEYISALCDFGGNCENDLVVDTDPWVENAFIRFENGLTCNITPNEGNNIRLHLSGAIITINGDGYSIDISTEANVKGRFYQLQRQLGEPARSGAQVLFADLAKAIINATPVVTIRPEEILAGTRLLSGITESGLKDGAKLNYKDVRDNLVITGRFGQLYA